MFVFSGQLAVVVWVFDQRCYCYFWRFL